MQGVRAARRCVRYLQPQVATLRTRCPTHAAVSRMALRRPHEHLESSSGTFMQRGRTGFRTYAVEANVADPQSLTPDGSAPSWKIRMLYDGDCPLCLREVNFLRNRDTKGAIDFVDIASPDYEPDSNAGLTFEQAMGEIHAILPDGSVVTKVEVFRMIYEAVGLGWVYAITKVPGVEAAANAVYDVWAKYRLPITGRPDLVEVLRTKSTEACGPVRKAEAQKAKEDARSA